MADADHYTEAADGLEAAAKALRACAPEEAAEPKNLKEAAQATRDAFRKARSGEQPSK